MLRHIVSWKLNGETLAERDEQAERVRAVIEPLRDSIAEVRALSLHRNELHDGANFDLTLIADFDDEAGLAAYAVHPEHQPAIALLKELAAGRVATDFTI